MPEPTDEELGLDPTQMESLDPNIRAELRRSRQLSRDNATLQAEAAQAKREASFAKAGIPSSPIGEMFAKAYDGPTDDPAAIKAAFDGLGVTEPVQAEQQQADLSAQRQVAQIGSQGEPGGDIRYEDALKSAKNSAELMELLANAPEGATDSEGRRIGVPIID